MISLQGVYMYKVPYTGRVENKHLNNNPRRVIKSTCSTPYGVNQLPKTTPLITPKTMGHTPPNSTRLPIVRPIHNKQTQTNPKKKLKREKPRVPLVIGPEIFWKDGRWSQLDSIMREKASKKGGGAG